MKGLINTALPDAEMILQGHKNGRVRRSASVAFDKNFLLHQRNIGFCIVFLSIISSVNHELIERFFRKQCTAEEAKKIAAYLKSNPSVLEAYLSRNEWDAVVPDDTISEDFWNDVWQSIQQKRKRKIVTLRLKRFIAAASIIILAGAVYFYFSPAKENKKSLAGVDVATQRKLLPEIQHKTVVNNTKKSLRVVLEDNSVIELSPASFVKYDVPFPKEKRDIILEGEAKFHVAKNKQKPFTVYAGALATTALGTIFTVKKSVGKNIISVKLFKGKVVIHATLDNLKGWKQAVYLQPGEQLKFNAESASVAVEKMNTAGRPGIAERTNKNDTQAGSANDQLTFNNTLLPEVMNKLSAYYNVTIRYDTLLIRTMNFTGTVSRTDSLPVILKIIAQMNGLEMSKDNNEYIISKHNDQ